MMCSSSTETDSHPHHCSPGLLTSLTYGDGYMTGLPVHSPSSHPLSTTPRRAFPSLTRALPYYPQEQTQFLPRIFKASTRWAQPTPPASSPSPGFPLRTPQTCQPYPCFTPPAIPSSLPAPLFLLSLPTAPNFFPANFYLASRSKSMRLSTFTPGKTHSLHLKFLIHALY